MKKKKIFCSILASSIAIMSLAGCGVNVNSNVNEVGVTATESQNTGMSWDEVVGNVSWPKEYKITYEVANEDGTVTTITKAIDESGNIYYKTPQKEEVFLYSDGYYEQYLKDDDEKFERNESEKYKLSYVENDTKEFNEYAQQNTLLSASAAKSQGIVQAAGRECNSYLVEVNVFNFSHETLYMFDTETKICMGISNMDSVSGHESKGNSEFTCIEFETEQISFELPTD